MEQPEREWQRLERKASFGREVVKTVAAFCNTEGGVIELGVGDDGHPTGRLTVGGNTLEGWANNIKRETDPGQTPSMVEEERQGRTVVIIRVPVSPIKPVLAHGAGYRRVGRTNQTMGYGEMERLFEQTTGRSWDSHHCPDASLADISGERVGEFVAGVGEARDHEMPGNAEAVLAKLGLIRDEALSLGAVLLFGTDPQAYLPQSVVKCARFAGRDSREFVDEKTLYGGVLRQVEEAYQFALRHTSKAIAVEAKPRRRETWEYPPDAVRELLVNAICHRDYQHTGNVQLRIYDGLLEVWTPGGLPDGVTAEMLQREHESMPRNPLIANAFFLTGLIEQWGWGTLRAIDACRDAGLPDPEFEDQGHTFVARVRLKALLSDAELTALGMNERQVTAVRYVEEHGEITNTAYREINDVSSRTATNELRGVVDAGILAAVGEGRARRYVRPEDA